MYKLKFDKLPKGIKKHFKSNQKERKKFYSLAEANSLFSNAVNETKAKGKAVVIVICPTGESEYEFNIWSDPDQPLSIQILKDFDGFLNTKQTEIEVLCRDPEKNKDKIKELEEDILLLTNHANEIKKEFDQEDEYEQDDAIDPQEEIDIIIDEYDDVFTETELFEGIPDETEFVDDVLSDIPDFPDFPNIEDEGFETDEDNDLPEPEPEHKPITSKNTRVIRTETKPTEIIEKIDSLDVTTIEAIQTLEERIAEIDKQIKKGVDHYIFDELYLTSATDFTSVEKKALIRNKYLSQASQTLRGIYDRSKASLDELKRFALNQLNAKYDELSASKASVKQQRMVGISEMLQVSFDKKKEELRKEIIAKCDAEIAEMYERLDEEKSHLLATEIEKIDQSLVKDFNNDHGQSLTECHAEISKIADEKASKVFEFINQGYSNLLDEIKTNLSNHEKDIEARYQLYKEDKKDQFTKEISNRELELRIKQLEIEERKLSQSTESKALSEQVEQLKMALEKNRLEDQMKLMSRDKEEQAEEMRKFKMIIGISFVLIVLTIAGVIAFLI